MRGNAKLKTCKKYSVQLEIWHTVCHNIYIKKNYIQEDPVDSGKSQVKCQSATPNK